MLTFVSIGTVVMIRRPTGTAAATSFEMHAQLHRSKITTMHMGMALDSLVLPSAYFTCRHGSKTCLALHVLAVVLIVSVGQRFPLCLQLFSKVRAHGFCCPVACCGCGCDVGRCDSCRDCFTTAITAATSATAATEGCWTTAAVNLPSKVCSHGSPR